MKKGIDISMKNGRRVVTGQGYYQTCAIKDLRELVKGSALKFGERTGFKFKDKAGKITGKTYRDFDNDIDYLGTALISMGLMDTNMSVIGENRYEWGVSFFSIVNGAGVAVPMDKYLPQNEVEKLIERGRAEAIFYSPSFHGMMEDIAKTNRRIKFFICMEALPEGYDINNGFVSMPDLIAKGRQLVSEGDVSYTGLTIDTQKMSVLLFTSGTTSIAKGVMLSHANLASNVMSISATIKVYETDVHLSILPLHHTFENTVGLMFMVFSGVCIAYCEGIKYIAQNIHEYDVTVLVAVPAILEAMYKRLQAGIKASGKDKSVSLLTGISDVALTLGIDIRRKLFKSIFEKIGKGLRLAVSGAAPLDPKVVSWFDKIGLRLLNGYGLTETSPVVAANNDFVNRPGTIGYPIAGVEVAIDSPDENGMGEIITRGGNVMLGYYEDTAATAEVIDAEGWFRTGDLGTIDQQGFIKVTGRAKSMIVLGNGKKAFPEEYEVLLNNINGVKDSFVWGNTAPDGDIQICAEIIPDREKMIDTDGKKLSDDVISDTIIKAVKDINNNIPKYKIIRYFILNDDDIIKTTTLKIKRNIEYDKVKILLDKAGLDMRKASGKFVKKEEEQ